MQTVAPLAAIAASLRRERDRAGLSLGQLAASAGVSKSTLSQLESGQGNPSLETLWALSTALGVTISLLIDPPAPRVRVLRADEGPALTSENADYRCTLLASGPPHIRRDLYRIVAEPGAARKSEPHMDGIVEHVLLCAGRAQVGPTDDPVELGPGDYASYPGDRPHVFEALEPGTVALMATDNP